MRKKKVLILIDWFLPGERAGGPVRSVANLIDHLGEEFEFSVITRDTDYTVDQPYSTIRSNEWNILPDGKRVFYFSKEELSKSKIQRLVEEEDPDILYLNGIWSVPFTHWPLMTKRKDRKTIVAVRGMLAPSAMAIKRIKKKVFLSYARSRGLFANVIFHATTEKEKKEVEHVFGSGTEICVAANLSRATLTDHQPKTKRGTELHIVSVARIAPEKNTLYAIEVVSALQQPVVFDLYGTTYDKKYRDDCDRAIANLPKHVKVTIHDAVPAKDVPSLLSNHDLLFLPTRGENFGHIILESLQAGTPVLISDQTPWKDLEIGKAGWSLPLNEKLAFVERLNDLSTMGEEEYLKWSEGALKRATEYLLNDVNLQANKFLFS